MIPWERFTRWTERYGHLWARTVLVLAAAVVAAIFYAFAYTISLIAC